jgi:hypothetical protein
MFAVRSGVEVSSRPTGRASMRGALLAATGRSTGAQRSPVRTLTSGRGVATVKAGSTGIGRASARGPVEPLRADVPWAIARTTAAAAPHATSAATARTRFPIAPGALSRLIGASAG